MPLLGQRQGCPIHLLMALHTLPAVNPTPLPLSPLLEPVLPHCFICVLVPQHRRPYLMDLGSTNGTFLNGERLEPERYYELLEQVPMPLLGHC